jgi:hypothetical protein
MLVQKNRQRIDTLNRSLPSRHVNSPLSVLTYPQIHIIHKKKKEAKKKNYYYYNTSMILS